MHTSLRLRSTLFALQPDLFRSAAPILPECGTQSNQHCRRKGLASKTSNVGTVLSGVGSLFTGCRYMYQKGFIFNLCTSANTYKAWFDFARQFFLQECVIFAWNSKSRKQFPACGIGTHSHSYTFMKRWCC